MADPIDSACMYCGAETVRARWFGMVRVPLCVPCIDRWRDDNEALESLSVRWMRRYEARTPRVPLASGSIRLALGDDAISPIASEVYRG